MGCLTLEPTGSINKKHSDALSAFRRKFRSFSVQYNEIVNRLIKQM